MPKFLTYDDASKIVKERFAIEEVVTASADFTAVANDRTYYSVTTSSAAASGLNVTLPSATTARIGLTLTFKRRGTKKLNILCAGSDTIDGDTLVVLTSDKAVVSVRVIALNVWEIVG